VTPGARRVSARALPRFSQSVLSPVEHVPCSGVAPRPRSYRAELAGQLVVRMDGIHENFA